MTKPVVIPPPAALARRGITTVTDDLPDGMEVQFAKDFAAIFAPELAQRFLVPAAPVPGESGCLRRK